MAESAKPLPRVTSVTQPYWEAAAQKRLVIQRCLKCEEYVWCPRPACTECGSNQLEWKAVSGRGTVFSFTIIRQVMVKDKIGLVTGLGGVAYGKNLSCTTVAVLGSES